MRVIEDYDLNLFAINTGELYQTHLYMARNHATVAGWMEYLKCQVLPLYCKQVERVTYDWETVANVAQSLKDYYERQIAESKSHQDRVDRCYEQGAQAWRDGKPRVSPWPNLPEFSQAWLEGWDVEAGGGKAEKFYTR